MVVGVDGSEGAVRALRWAARTARSVDAPLVAVIACEAPDLCGGTPAQEVREAGLRLATSLRRAFGTDPVVRAGLTEKVREGRPVPVLIEASRGARLLVVGSRHVDGPDDPLGGSLTTRLVHRALCPVVAVVAADPETPAGPTPPTVSPGHAIPSPEPDGPPARVLDRR